MSRVYPFGLLLLCWVAVAEEGGAEGRYASLLLDVAECPLLPQAAGEAVIRARCKGVGGYALEREEEAGQLRLTLVSPEQERVSLGLEVQVSRDYTLAGEVEWWLQRLEGELQPVALVLGIGLHEGEEGYPYLALVRLAGAKSCLQAVLLAEEAKREQAVLKLAVEGRCWGLPEGADAELELLYATAVAGDPYAQREVGWRFQQGEGVALDLQQALHWYRRAAAWGDAVAQNDLGFLYGSGLGVERDVALAAEWYRRAAMQGNPLATANLAALGLTPPPLPPTEPVVACPPQLRTRQLASDDLGEWVASDDGSAATLRGAALYLGPPEGGSELFAQAGAEGLLHWRVPQQTEGVWLVCNYAATRVRLSRRLPESLTACSADLTPTTGPEEIMRNVGCY